MQTGLALGPMVEGMPDPENASAHDVLEAITDHDEHAEIEVEDDAELEDGAVTDVDAEADDATDDVEVDEDAPRDAAEMGTDAARAEWALAAREVLLGTARRYHAVITTKDLAAQVQVRTGITTSQPVHYWIDDVLGRVASDCASRGEPNLASLAVNAEGSVGSSYANAVGGTSDAPADHDNHAARERLASYQLVDAVGLPSDGGVAALTSKLAASRTRSRKAKLEAREIPTCPTCYLALPASGVCDNCA